MNSISQSQTAPSDAFPLQARQLVKTYESRTLLDRVTLDVPQGAVLGLIGRNGAGKTTLLRCLLGLIEPGGGEAFVFGERALAMTDHTKQRLGYVPQHPDALAWLEVGEMLDFVGRFYPRWDGRYVDVTLRRWGLTRHRVLKTLSPGERQRVALIRALALQPDLLVLDEPAASMDPVARRDLLRDIVTRTVESGTTVVFSTHIVSDLERVASHVAFLHNGRLLLNAPLDDIKERVARIIVPPIVAAQLRGALPGERSRRKLNDGRLSLVIERAADGDWPEIVEAPGAQHDALGLEDLFIEIVE
ncbi:MAG TPA: ABC transporter ATP-binding protein [Xanthomonadaceae bacterium]|nr:ABC transporter ATP-binding protein [Xanthomonadaceae bacterium]